MGWIQNVPGVLVSGPQTLTDETTSGTTEEQWGTEELVVSGAGLGTTVKVLAHLTGFAERADGTAVTGERGAGIRIDVSLDGGSTWDTANAGRQTLEWHGDENTNSRMAVGVQKLTSGTRTGDIQVRAMVTTFHAAGKPVFKDGCITAVVTHS